MKTEKVSLEIAMRTTRCREHPHCYACREPADGGLGLCFAPDGAGGVLAEWMPSALWEGYPGMLHGGIIATLLDSAMVHVLFAAGVVARTADLHVRYRAPVLIRDRVQLHAELRDQRPPFFRLDAALWQKGIRCACAEAKFLSTSGVIQAW